MTYGGGRGGVLRMFGGVLVALCVAAVSSFSTAATVSDPLTVVSSAHTVEELATVFSSLFPPVDGEVLSVDGERLTITLPGDAEGTASLRPGQLLTVYRTGPFYRHPLTGVPLAHSEETLGKAVVEETDGARAIARMASGPLMSPVRSGDRVRLSTGRLPVAVTARTTTSGSMPVLVQFREALEETGRFQVVPVARAVDAPTEAPASATSPALPGRADTLAAAMEGKGGAVEYFFFVDTMLRAGVVVADIEIVETLTGRTVDAVNVPLRLDPASLSGELQTVSTQDPVLQLLSATEGRAVREARVPYLAEHLVVGDLDNDGTDEVVVSDGTRLRLYHMVDLDLQLVTEEAAGRHDRRHVSVGLGRLPGRDRPLLFVTAMAGDRLDSYVVEWREGAFQTVAEHEPFYFQLITRPGRPDLLIGQQRALHQPFYGPVVRMAWSGTSFSPGDPLPLPDGVGLYDFTLVDLDSDGRDEVIYLDSRDYLVVATAAGDVLGTSDESYGGVETFVEYMPAGIVRSVDERPSRVRIPSRLIVADLDQDGTLEIVVPKNVALAKVIERAKGYRYGQIFALGWSAGRLEQKWVIPKVDGVIADLGFVQWLGAGAGPQVVILSRATLKDRAFKDLFASRSQLLLYTVPRG